jgi:uncharacterized protein (DUF2384 family)
VYAAALQHDRKLVQMTGIDGLDTLSQKNLNTLKSSGGIVTTPLRSFLSNTTADLQLRLKSAVILARIEGRHSISTIRPFLESVNSQEINVASLPHLIKVCDMLDLPDGKMWAYEAIKIYSQFESMNGIMHAREAFVAAVHLLVAHSDSESKERLGKLVDTFAKKLEAMATQYTMAQLDVPREGLEVIVKEIAASSDQELTAVLISFIKWATSLSSKGRQLSSNQFVRLTNIVAIRKIAREGVQIWQKSGNTQALSILNESLGVEQVEAFLESKE